jgi:UDP-N-acetylmuramate dehydrogenase
MDIKHAVSLADHSTMGLGGPALHLVEVTDRNQVQQAVAWATAQKVPVVMIGVGSNIIWNDSGFPGLVIVNKILGYEAYEEDDTNTYLTIGAGEPWDAVVARSVEAGLTGIEALSLIPGTAGATPVQNVGAYGQEIAQTLTTIEAYDAQTSGFVTIPVSDCGFGYRTSRFKTGDHGRFFITGITLHLRKGNPLPPFYSSVQGYLEAHGITVATPAAIREAVIAIRNAKLPDPAVVRNCGSFFGNPIVSDWEFAQIAQRYETVPHWASEEQTVKLSAAWLIEQAGFKDVHDKTTGMATWPQQSLVLINEHAKNTADLLAFKQSIVAAVQEKFNVTLKQEPELIA